MEKVSDDRKESGFQQVTGRCRTLGQVLLP